MEIIHFLKHKGNKSMSPGTIETLNKFNSFIILFATQRQILNIQLAEKQNQRHMAGRLRLILALPLLGVSLGKSFEYSGPSNPQ